MIELTRLQGQKLIVNVDLIEFIEESPDTLLSMTTGKKVMVRETVSEVIEKAAAFHRLCNLAPKNKVRKGDRRQ